MCVAYYETNETQASETECTEACWSELMKLKYYHLSAVIFVNCNETQASETERAETC